MGLIANAALPRIAPHTHILLGAPQESVFALAKYDMNGNLLWGMEGGGGGGWRAGTSLVRPANSQADVVSDVGLTDPNSRSLLVRPRQTAGCPLAPRSQGSLQLRRGGQKREKPTM